MAAKGGWRTVGVSGRLAAGDWCPQVADDGNRDILLSGNDLRRAGQAVLPAGSDVDGVVEVRSR